jgi:hypothetical protein
LIALSRLFDIREIETALNTFDPICQAIDAIGYFGKPHVYLRNFGFEGADTLLHLAHVFAQAIDRTADVP